MVLPLVLDKSPLNDLRKEVDLIPRLDKLYSFVQHGNFPLIFVVMNGWGSFDKKVVLSSGLFRLIR